MTNKTSVQLLLYLLQAGLWERDFHFYQYRSIDFTEIYRLAQEQSVVGLVAAGLEQVKDIKVPKENALMFVGEALQLEQRNIQMNSFVEEIVDKMRHEDINALLVKGQGIAQCYERPLWRTCGDVDFLLSDSNYDKAKTFLSPIASNVEPEGEREKHQGFIIESWSVELHGSLRCGLSKKMDRVIDEIQKDVFCEGKVRSWMNGQTQVFLPEANCDTLFVFTHFIKHFYKEGLGLRQICDWCRLLWTYRVKIDRGFLETKLHSMGLMSEWKAFGAFAVYYLGMPAEAMPLYSTKDKWRRKAERIFVFILEVGNFGHNRDSRYFQKKPYIVRKAKSFVRRCGDLYNHVAIFPLDSLRFFPNILINGLRSALNGE